MPALALVRLQAMLQQAHFRLQRRPAVGRVKFGSLRRLRPISDQFGFDRGQCIDRFYIERFLAAHRADIHGRVLEVQDNTYTTRFGGTSVTRSDVLDVRPVATASVSFDLVGEPPAALEAAFDCIIVTQTLQFIFDLPAAVANLRWLLRPGGVVLATVPGLSQLSPGDRRQYGEHWRLTSDSAARLFRAAFGADHVEVAASGNVLAAIGLLHGLAVADLSVAELEVTDPNYEVIVSIRAVAPPR
jgi:SAM-dependent methyltransferase